MISKQAEELMNRVTRILALPAMAICLTSCSSVRTYYYIIDTNLKVPRAERQLPLTVGVNNIRAPSRYQDQMVYRTSEHEAGFYEYSRWIEHPAEMVQRALLDGLKDSGLFQRADPADAVVNPDLTLQSVIAAFDQVLAKEGNFAECELRFELLQGYSGKVVWSYDAKVRMPQKGKGKFVQAMSETVAKAITDAIADMEKSQALQKLAEAKEKSRDTKAGTSAAAPGNAEDCGGPGIALPVPVHTIDLMESLPLSAGRFTLRT